MPLDGRRRLAELGDFLAALRQNGVPVGAGEIQRLRHLFAREPRLDRAGLKTLLGALLVKTPAQRRVFENLFAAWCPDREADWPEPEIPAPQPPSPTPALAGKAIPSTDQPTDTEPPRRFPKWLPPALAGLGVVIFLIWALWPPSVVVIEQPEPDTQPIAITEPGNEDPQLPDRPVKTAWSWQIAPLEPEAVRVPNRLGPLPLALLGAMAVTLALGLWWRYRRRFPVIEPISRPYRGFGWQPLPPPPRDDSALLDARSRRQLVWRIEQFIADDPTRRLNLPETVEQTARAGGFVKFCFDPAVYERAIWFWLDRQLEPRTPWDTAAQLQATLRAAGLEAQRGLFTEVPQRIDWPEQRGYRPVAEEGQGRQALVAIFCDGTGLARQLDHPLRRESTRRLLNSLRHWPRLCFVDCSTRGDLSALFAAHRFRLEVVTLEQLPDWLGGLESGSAADEPAEAGLFGGARQWAAVTALGNGQADVATAHTLRVSLGIAVSPWRIDEIMAASTHPEPRRRLINWLLRSEPRRDGALQPRSLARRALDWWQARYDEAEQSRQDKENPLLPWQDSLASRRWQMEQALLRLYTNPERAAERLAKLADEELRAEIHDRLSEFAAADHQPSEGDEEGRWIFLTWRFAPLSATTRHRLRELGFASGLYPEERKEPPPLKYSPRLVLALTMLGTLGLAAFAVAGYRWWFPEPPRLLVRNEVHDHPVLAAQTLRLVEPITPNRYRITLGSPRRGDTLEVLEVPAGAEVPVSWHWTEQDNPVRLQDSDSVLLHAGSLAQPIRACGDDWPRRSLAVIAAPYSDQAARQLAIRLLDKGSADQVLLGTAWEDHFQKWLGDSRELNHQTQVLVILSDAGAGGNAAERLADHPGTWAVVAASDLAGLAVAIDFPGTESIDGTSLPWRKLDGHGMVMVSGGPETTLENGIEWVSICPGTFTMGSEKNEATAQDDEIVEPPRVVALRAFQIAAAETTNRQYARAVSNHKSQDDQPVVDVSWEQARSFCRAAGGDLPTEAQWEYAARGGSRTPWSFGEDENQLGRYAWFADNSGYQAHEVKQKRPNPLGLYDMHGNVWEWVRDWYGDYQSGTFVDPEGSQDGNLRVVRGGSFDDSPGDLRSADRFDDFPVNWVGRDGFRCVRVPPPA